MSKPIVFVGPSLRASDLHGRGLDVRPPAAQGDIVRALQNAPPAIGLIDGVFGSVLSVHQKEILEALSAGVAVYGAASMGALRATELERYGMVGIGRIFADFASGRVDDDAYVAVAHAPAELGSGPVTVSQADVAATLDAMRATGQFAIDALARLLDVSAAMHFTDRTIDAVARAAGPMPFDVVRALNTHNVEQKRMDALALLDALAAPHAIKAEIFPLPMTQAYATIRARALDHPRHHS